MLGGTVVRSQNRRPGSGHYLDGHLRQRPALRSLDSLFDLGRCHGQRCGWAQPAGVLGHVFVLDHVFPAASRRLVVLPRADPAGAAAAAGRVDGGRIEAIRLASMRLITGTRYGVARAQGAALDTVMSERANAKTRSPVPGRQPAPWPFKEFGRSRWPTLINTPLQRGVRPRAGRLNRFSGLRGPRQTAEAVPRRHPGSHTSLKRGVNESGYGSGVGGLPASTP